MEQKEKNKRQEEAIEKLNIEQQIKDENQTTLELSDRIIASPRKLTVVVFRFM